MSGIIIDTWYGINADWQSIHNSPWPAHLLPDTTNGRYNYIPKMSQIPNSSEMVWLYDGIFYDLDFSAQPHQRQAWEYEVYQPAVLRRPCRATYATEELPGGIGDANTPINPFSNTVPIPPSLTGDTNIRWRTDY